VFKWLSSESVRGEDQMSKSEDREVFEIYAVKYAHNANRTRNGNMLYMDEHDVPMPLDYFVWVITNDSMHVLSRDATPF
tara:strand:- start:1491 stop:1727 length:237 start_codon:yes stop_codon:yes gene_type:complete